MIILNATTKSLQFVLGGTVTTNQLVFSTSYVDVTTTATTPGANDGVSNNTTAVTLVSAPAASTERMIKNIIIQNADTATATITIIYNDNSTLRNIFTSTLSAGYQFVYEDGEGFAVYNSNGTILSSAVITGVINVPLGGTGLTSLTNHAVLLGAGTGNVNFSPVLTAGRIFIDQGASADPVFEVMSGDATITNLGAITVTKSSGNTIETAAFQNIGTSGANVPLLNGSNTWSGPQTYTNSDLLLLGSSTGATTFTSANAGASNFTLTIPAYTGTAVVTTTSSPAQGDIAYFNGTNWVDLAPGTSGSFLKTQGVSANPVWAVVNPFVASSGTATAGGTTSAALGPSSSSGATSDIAIGNTATTSASSGTLSIAIGPNATVTSNATSGQTIAIGSSASAGDVGNSVVIGVGAKTTGTGTNNIAIGTLAEATTGSNNVIIGHNSQATGSVAAGHICIGNVARASGTIGSVILSNAGVTDSVGGCILIGVGAGGPANVGDIQILSSGSVGLTFNGSTGLMTITGTSSGAFLATTTSLANGAGSSAGTLTNAPSVGNPTKWISINDNGVIRKIPAW